MPPLPIDAVAAAEFLVRRLYRPIETAAGARYFAMAETGDPAADQWFWNDDNAKILELMARPEVWRRFPQQTSEILRFVQSMWQAPFLFRRIAAPRLDLVSTEGSISAYRHSMMRLRCDLTQGAVVAGIRFHDERSAENLLLGGNYVAFTYRGRRFKQPVATGGAIRHAEPEGALLRLRHGADVALGSGWRRRRLGEIAYTYTFDARSMLFEIEAALALDPGVELADIVLTIGHGALAYCLFNNVVTDRTKGAAPLYAAGVPSARSHAADGAAYYAIRQGHISADSLAVHGIPLTPARLSGIETAVETQGRLDRVVARYEFPGAHRGARLVAAEHKLITAGGFYDRVADYAALMRAASAAKRDQQAACDFSISYDYGVTLNALAKCFAAAQAGSIPADRFSSPDRLRPLFDDMLTHYCELYGCSEDAGAPNAVYSRELAFAALGVATMFGSTGADAYLRRLRPLADALLGFERRFEDQAGAPASAFLMRRDNDKGYFDCHSAALLALTRCADLIDDPALPAAIERGLSSYGLLTGAADLGSLHKLDTVAIAMPGGTGHEHTAFWNFKAGLALRFFAALRRSSVAALQEMAARHADRIALFEAILRQQLARSTIRRRDGIEIRTSVLSGETNSETQPWAVLGLLGDACE